MRGNETPERAAGTLSERDGLIPPVDLLRRFEMSGSVEQFKEIGRTNLNLHLLLLGRLKPHEKVLDIGCGVGKVAWALAGYLSGQAGYCGFDIQPHLIEWCRDHYASLGNFSFDFADVRSDWYSESGRSAESYRFPYGDDHFDVAWAGSLFTHLQPAETSNYLREAARVLKPGGRLILTCFLVNEHNGGQPSLRAERQRTFVPASTIHRVLDPAKPSKAVAYDENALRRMVADTGMIVSTMLFGRWANGEGDSFQDCLVALKPTVA